VKYHQGGCVQQAVYHHNFCPFEYSVKTCPDCLPLLSTTLKCGCVEEDVPAIIPTEVLRHPSPNWSTNVKEMSIAVKQPENLMGEFDDDDKNEQHLISASVTSTESRSVEKESVSALDDSNLDLEPLETRY